MMIALKVTINNQTSVVGGAPDLGVLSAILTCVGKLGEAAVPPRPNEEAHLGLSLGGLTSRPKDAGDEHLRWLQSADLKVGDTVTIEIVEVESADPVEQRQPMLRKMDPDTNP